MDVSTRALVVMTVVAVCWISHTQAVALCTQVSPTACTSCTLLGRCTQVGQPVEPTTLCRNGQVCGVVNGVAACIDAAGTPCECMPYTLGCDEFDPQGLTLCRIDEGVVPGIFLPHLAHSCDFSQKCSAGRCVDANAIITTPTTTTTTAKPNTCTSANSDKRYPHELDCKKYYTCREVRRGIFSYLISTCPGSLFFDRVKGYCDVPANVTC